MKRLRGGGCSGGEEEDDAPEHDFILCAHAVYWDCWQRQRIAGTNTPAKHISPLRDDEERAAGKAAVTGARSSEEDPSSRLSAAGS